MNCWVVYVPGAKAQLNYAIGKEKGIWGLKKITEKSQIRNIQIGDQIIFVKEVKWQPYNGPVPNGFPKFLKNEQDFKGIASEIVIGNITKGYYQDMSSVWPDSIYPHRFNFEINEQTANVLFNTEEFDSGLIRATLQSIKSGGSVCLVNSNDIIQTVRKIDELGLDPFEEDENFYVTEGASKFIANHKSLERNPTIIKKKKQQVLKQKKCLECEICGFDFVKIYGEKLGDGFIECHHTNPLSDSGETKTKLSDLILVCSNCHKMIHRRRPWITPAELKSIMENQINL